VLCAVWRGLELGRGSRVEGGDWAFVVWDSCWLMVMVMAMVTESGPKAHAAHGTQRSAHLGVVGDAVKGERGLARGQAHEVEAWGAAVQHQLRVLLVKHLAVIHGADELRVCACGGGGLGTGGGEGGRLG